MRPGKKFFWGGFPGEPFGETVVSIRRKQLPLPPLLWPPYPAGVFFTPCQAVPGKGHAPRETTEPKNPEGMGKVPFESDQVPKARPAVFLCISHNMYPVKKNFTQYVVRKQNARLAAETFRNDPSIFICVSLFPGPSPPRITGDARPLSS